MKLLLATLLFSLLGSQRSVYAQADNFSGESGTLTLSREGNLPSRTRYGTFNTFLVGPRINYIQGKYGFLGCSGAFMWHNVHYIFESHIGFSAGMDFRLTKSPVYVPKVTFEYRYLIGVARVGYNYLTDFKSDLEHRISAEIGLSLFGFLDLTYLHSFGSDRNPFQLEANYLNLTATIPFNL
ncbi:hypothetical protein D3C87_308780 [compost metagenome]